MRTLTNILEGLLDADFDITDKDVMPGVKNWPRFLGRLSNIPKPKLVDGGKYRKWTWQGDDVIDIISQGTKLDIGPAISRSKAIDISIDREQIIIAAFWPRGNRYAGEICIGNNDGYVVINARRLGYDGPIITTAGEMANLGLRLSTIEVKNWKLRVAPLQAYDIIKRELGLL